MRPTSPALALLLLVAGCSVPRKGGFDAVDEAVLERTGQRVHWYQGTPEDEQVAEKVRTLLSQELSVDAAVQIALLGNRTLQAAYEDLGVTQADLVQAGLLKNPSLESDVGFPDRPPLLTKLDFTLAQDFLDVLTMPSRKRLATMEFEGAKKRVTNEVLRIVAETRAACCRVQAAMQVSRMLHEVEEAAGAAAELARRQYDAGNIPDMERDGHAAEYEQVKMEVADAEAEVFSERERLTRLMGVWGLDTEWKIAPNLADLPADEIPLEHLESLAIAQRQDLAASLGGADRLEEAVAIARGWRWVGRLDVAVHAERETDRQQRLGPHVEVELPIFDQGQARIAKLEAEARQARREAEALAIEIRSDVRDLRQRMLHKRRNAEQYRSVLIPLRERIVASLQKHYNFMLVGVYQLLQARREEIETYRSYLETLRDYWVLRAELEQAVGGRLSPPSPETHH